MSEKRDPDATDEILELIYRGQKLAAIKRYREAHGATLGEAKAFIEQLTEKLRAAEPERFASQTKPGCSGVLVCLAVILALPAWMIAKATQFF